jgi:hypothetical protein
MMQHKYLEHRFIEQLPERLEAVCSTSLWSTPQQPTAAVVAAARKWSRLSLQRIGA